MSESFVWKYFAKIHSEQLATCKECKAEIKCKGWSTSGLIRHLHAKHNINKSTTDSDRKDEQTECSTKKRKTSPRTPTAVTVKKNTLQEIVSKLAALDGITISSIAKSEFIRQSLTDRGFTLPKNPARVMDLIHVQYDRIKRSLVYKISQQIASGARFSISLDEYSSLNNRRYLNINVHGDEGKFWNLGMIRISSSKAAAHIVEEKLAEFHISLEKHVVACVTDGTPAMNKLGRIIKCEHQLCYAHGIHLAVCDVLYQKTTYHTVNFTEEKQTGGMYNTDESEEDFNSGIEIESAVSEYEYNDESLFEINISPELYDMEVSQTINKIRKTVRMFLKSPVKNDVLQEYVKQDHGKTLQLILDSKTRWNSLLAMLERYIKIRPSVMKALVDLKEDKNDSLALEEQEVDVINDLVTSLEPLKLAIEKLGKRESTLLIADDIISFVLNELKDLNNPFSKKLFECVLLRIKERRNAKLLGLLLYLTGGKNYKRESAFPALPDGHVITSAKQIFDRLFGEPVIYDTSEEIGLKCETEFQTAMPPNEMTLADKLNAYLEASERSRITTELAAISKKSSGGEQLKNELAIFEKTGVKTQKISLLLRALKTIPSTSIESERAFSAAGLFVSKLRTQLSDRSIDHFCFLKSYYQNQ